MTVQVILNGLVAGMGLAVMAIAFSVVYVPCRVFHISLAGIFSFTPYIAMTAVGKNLPWWSAIMLALLAAICLSLSLEIFNHRRLEQKCASHASHIIASLGAFILIIQTTALIWGNDSQMLRRGINRTIMMGDIVVTRAQGVTAGASLIILAALFFWLKYSKIGLRFRALADNPMEFGLFGYNVNRYRLLAFAVSGMLGGTAALMMAYDKGFDPHGGLHMLLLAIVAVIIGGRGSFLGPVLGGLLIGLLRAQVAWHFSAHWQEVFTFVMLAAFLYARPNGICGQASRLEDQE